MMFRPLLLRSVYNATIFLIVGIGHSAWSDEPTHIDALPKLQYRRWSGTINVPDPVAISVADNGDVYVTQTQRRKIQDLDIREHSEWIPEDVGLTSVDAKRDFYRRVLAIGGDSAAASKHVADVNGDGKHDWRDLTVISEKIHRLVDTDGDSTADRINLFAEDFKTEVTGIAAGVMHWQDSVWATIAPDVWKLTDTNGDGAADQREIIVTGFGLHIAYAGHDMHGLTIGPDGKVYWSIGDKGIAVTTADGQSVNYPNQGGVMRCNIDGSDFEVFAHGLRNVQEFAFDQFGNFFGVDNDADKPGEQERFVWIVDQMDAGWRCNYQYRGNKYDPWTAEKLWQVAGDDHPAYLVPPIQNYVDGPAGFKFNPGGALSAAYRNFFFVTSAPNGFQYAFRTEPTGDTFRMVDSHQIGSGDPIVGIAFGPDGGLYGADWGGGYPLTQTGSVIRIDVPDMALTPSDREIRHSVLKYLTEGFEDLSTDRLSELLGHVDQRVRLRAQFSLVARRQSKVMLKLLSLPATDQLARVHCVWGLGQLIRTGHLSAETLSRFLADSDPVIRCVTAKTLGETRDAQPSDFVPLLDDPDLHVRIHAALALGRRPTTTAVQRLLDLARQLPRDQHYMRHAIVTALATCARTDQLTMLTEAPSQMSRLCAVLALRRKGEPSVAAFLSDSSPWVATEAARAIHDDLSIESAMEALAAALDQTNAATTPMTLRCINANLRLGTQPCFARLIRYAADRRHTAEMRIAACEAIGDWMNPPVLDRVDGRRRPSSGHRELDPAAAAKLFTRLVTQDESEIRVAAVKASRQLEISLLPDALLILVRDQRSPERLRAEALDAIASPNSGLSAADREQLMIELADDASEKIAAAAIRWLTGLNAIKATEVIASRLDSESLAVRQTCIESLAILSNPRTDAMLDQLATQFLNRSLPTAIHLDVWNALQARSEDSQQLRNVLDEIENLPEWSAIASSKMREFSMCRDGGDAERGEIIFRSDLRAQCIRCHRIGPQGSNIGPELTNIAKQRDADHLLRAVVYPSADIDPKYNAQTLLMADGNVIQGVIKSENDTHTILINSEGKELTIATDEIEDVAKTKVSLMPDMTDALRPSEVRDLVAFLKTLR